MRPQWSTQLSCKILAAWAVPSYDRPQSAVWQHLMCIHVHVDVLSTQEWGQLQPRMEAPRQVKALAELCEQLLARDRPMQFADTRCSRQSDQLNFETVVFHCLGRAGWGLLCMASCHAPNQHTSNQQHTSLHSQECETAICYQQTNMVCPGNTSMITSANAPTPPPVQCCAPYPHTVAPLDGGARAQAHARRGQVAWPTCAQPLGAAHTGSVP